MAFNINSPFFKFVNKLLDVLLLNLLMLACCVPLVTVGAAITAAYSVILKMVDDEEGYICRSFFRAFKENFRQGTLLWLITASAAYALYIEWQVVTKMDNVNFIFIVIAIISTAVAVCALLYTYPLAARYQNTLLNIIKNSFDISVYFFGRTLFIVALCCFEVCLFLWNKWLMLAGILVGPMVVIYTIAGIGKRIFQRIERDTPCPPAKQNPSE